MSDALCAEMTWLIAQAEQRYHVELDLSDEVFARMQTVSGAVEVLRATIGAALVAGVAGLGSSGLGSSGLGSSGLGSSGLGSSESRSSGLGAEGGDG